MASGEHTHGYLEEGSHSWQGSSSLQLQNVLNRALGVNFCKMNWTGKQTCYAHPAKPSFQNLKTSSRSPAHSDAQNNRLRLRPNKFVRQG